MKLVVATAYKNTDIRSVLIGVEGYIEYQGRNIVKSIAVAGTKWNVKIFKVPHIINKLVYRYFSKIKGSANWICPVFRAQLYPQNREAEYG